MGRVDGLPRRLESSGAQREMSLRQVTSHLLICEPISIPHPPGPVSTRLDEETQILVG